MTPSRDRQVRACSGVLILAMLGLAAGLAFLLIGRPGTSSLVPVYAASPLLPPALAAPPDGAVVSDTTPTLWWAASPEPAVGCYLKVDGWTKNVGAATSGEPNPLGDGPHSWTVSCYDGLGGESDDAPAWSFTVDTQPPPAPVLQSPSNGTATSNTSVTVAWTASAGAAGYRLNWNGTVSDVGDTTWHVLTGLADGTYSWSVAAYDAVRNLSAYTDTWSLIIDTMPPTVEQTVPADGATEVALEVPPEIRFSEAVDPNTFAFSISPDPGGWAAVWSADDQVVTLSHAAYRVTTAYTVTVTTVVDLAGLAMEESYSWSFETGMYGLYLPLVMRAHAP